MGLKKTPVEALAGTHFAKGEQEVATPRKDYREETVQGQRESTPPDDGDEGCMGKGGEGGTDQADVEDALHACKEDTEEAEGCLAIQASGYCF